jgi:lipid-A-disaccharide synthase-like uncharacterized protein
MQDLIGRTIVLHTPHHGADGQFHKVGCITEWLGSMRFGVQFIAYYMNGVRVTVDVHRREFILPKA